VEKPVLWDRVQVAALSGIGTFPMFEQGDFGPRKATPEAISGGWGRGANLF